MTAVSAGRAFRIFILAQHSAINRERQCDSKSVFIGVHPWFNFVVDDEPIQLPIDGVLDLHTFRPREVKDLVLDYLVECKTRGILRVRIIHGKGIGQLRQMVHSILERHPDVAEFHLASEHFGGWGATIVHLKPETQGQSAG